MSAFCWELHSESLVQQQRRIWLEEFHITRFPTWTHFCSEWFLLVLMIRANLHILLTHRNIVKNCIVPTSQNYEHLINKTHFVNNKTNLCVMYTSWCSNSQCVVSNSQFDSDLISFIIPLNCVIFLSYHFIMY